MNEAQLSSPDPMQAPLEGGKYVYCIIRSGRRESAHVERLQRENADLRRQLEQSRA